MLDFKDLTKLAKVTANADSSSNKLYSYGEDKFSYSDLNATLQKECQEKFGTPAKWRANKEEFFTLMEEVINDVLPKKALEQYGEFADIKTFNQGDKPIFNEKITAASRTRAKKFITKVGLAGIYEVFKLDGKRIEITTNAYGGAAQVSIEEFLDGRADFAAIIEIVMEGLDESVYCEIERALKATVSTLQAANKTTQNAFNETAMDRLIAVADAYGRATIYCTFEFAATMVPDQNWRSDRMADERWNNGYLANYKGHKVIVLDQSFDDETNSKKTIDPQYAYIIPTGATKPVKIAFEGSAVSREVENDDWSKEIQVYKKMGVGTIVTNNICAYVNTSLS